jgi:hypothetical protein
LPRRRSTAGRPRRAITDAYSDLYAYSYGNSYGHSDTYTDSHFYGDTDYMRNFFCYW